MVAALPGTKPLDLLHFVAYRIQHGDLQFRIKALQVLLSQFNGFLEREQCELLGCWLRRVGWEGSFRRYGFSMTTMFHDVALHLFPLCQRFAGGEFRPPLRSAFHEILEHPEAQDAMLTWVDQIVGKRSQVDQLDTHNPVIVAQLANDPRFLEVERRFTGTECNPRAYILRKPGRGKGAKRASLTGRVLLGGFQERHKGGERFSLVLSLRIEINRPCFAQAIGGDSDACEVGTRSIVGRNRFLNIATAYPPWEAVTVAQWNLRNGHFTTHW